MVTNNRARTPRRQAKWVEFAPTNHTITVGGQATQDLLLNLDGGTKGLTIVRTILTMQMFANSSEATGDMIRLDYGLALVDVEAASAGAFPDPGFPDQVAWLHRGFRVVVDDGATLRLESVVLVECDTPVARVLRDDRSGYRLIIDNSTVIGGGTATVLTAGRVLLKLP